MKTFLLFIGLTLIVMLPAMALVSPPLQPQRDRNPQPTLSEPAPAFNYFSPDETGRYFSAITQEMVIHFVRGGVLFQLTSGELVSLDFQGSNPNSTPQGQKPLAATANYYRGATTEQWREDVPLYAEVLYSDLYPGVDLRYTFVDGQLKSEFIVQPGAAWEKIQLHYDGIETLQLEEKSLQIIVGEHVVLSEVIPTAYQEHEGQRDALTTQFRLLGPHSYGFVIQEPLMSKATLVIDPVLRYTTYFGGTRRDEGWAITTDYPGNSYITGVTSSPNLPVLNPIQADHAGTDDKDVFIAKFDVDGNLVYATYYGGAAGEEGNAIAVDAEGNAYVTGQTYSDNLPMHNAWQAKFAGNEDAYVLKLDPQGHLGWATYIGGKGFEEANAIAVDQSGRVYVGGEVYSDDFPLLNPWRSTTYGVEEEDGFISIFDSHGQLLYSTYISAPQRDQIFAIAVDQNGHVYAAGMTSSPDFPAHNAVQSTYGGGWEDCLILKLDPWNNELHFATFLGGLDREACWGIDFDQEGNIYVSGYTSSFNFPTQNAYQSQRGGDFDAFVAKLNPSGTRLRYSTYLGGSKVDRSWGLVSDHRGYVYIAGQTDSLDFPTRNAIQRTLGGGEDGFVAIFTPTGDLHTASYLGGSGEDKIWGIALDGNWIAHLVGASDSPDLSTADAYQRHRSGAEDALLGRIAFIPTPTPTPTPTPYASEDIGPEGGALWVSYPSHLTMLWIPPEAVSTTTNFELIYDGRSDHQGGLEGINHFFALWFQPPENVQSPLQLDLTYNETRGVIVDTLALYRLSGGDWVTSHITITQQTIDYIGSQIDQPGIYGILGRTNRFYLPLTVRE